MSSAAMVYNRTSAMSWYGYAESDELVEEATQKAAFGQPLCGKLSDTPPPTKKVSEWP
jgi:hypothetical protein